MTKKEELEGIAAKYKENFQKIAKEFHEETGLSLDSVSFRYDIFVGEERIFDIVNVRLDVSFD